MPTKPTTTTKKAADAPKRYIVRSGGVSTPTGPVWNGEIADAERLGSVERIAALLAKGSIEEVTDAAD